MRVDRVKSSARAAQAIDSVPAVYHARSRNPSSHRRFRDLCDGVTSLYPYQRKKVHPKAEDRSNSARPVRHRTREWRVRRRSVRMLAWTMRTPSRPPATATPASSATCRRPVLSTAAPAGKQRRPQPPHPGPRPRPAPVRRPRRARSRGAVPRHRPPIDGRPLRHQHPRRERPPLPRPYRAPDGRPRRPTGARRSRFRRSWRWPTARCGPGASCCARSCAVCPATRGHFRDSATRGAARCNRLPRAELAVPCARRDGGTTVTGPEEPATGANRTTSGP